MRAYKVTWKPYAVVTVAAAGAPVSDAARNAKPGAPGAFRSARRNATPVAFAGKTLA